MRVEFTPSADRHTISHDAAVYAVENSLLILPNFLKPRPPSQVPPTLFIGPAGRYDQRSLEVFVEISADLIKVFHVMVATPANLELLGKDKQ